MRINKITCLALLFASMAAKADIKTDQLAGNCVAYMAVQQKSAGARAALAMADNQKRAIKFAELRMSEFEKYKNNKNLLESLIYSTSSDCRAIGIRKSDY